MVWINDHSYSHGAAQCSWGGVKDSGLGRSHSKFGLYECVNIKHVAWEPGLVRDFWWQPYDEDLGTALRSSARILYGRGGDPGQGAARGTRPADPGRDEDAAKKPLSAAASAQRRSPSTSTYGRGWLIPPPSTRKRSKYSTQSACIASRRSGSSESASALVGP